MSILTTYTLNYLRLNRKRTAVTILGVILSAALMLRHSLGLEDEAGSIEAACAAVLSAGAVTQDLGGTLGTREAANAVIDGVRAIHWAAAHRVQMHWA